VPSRIADQLIREYGNRAKQRLVDLMTDAVKRGDEVQQRMLEEARSHLESLARSDGLKG
jgi:hypothetical protein